MKSARDSGTAVMVLSGEYDFASKGQVRAAFDAVLEARRVALDFSYVTYVDSTIVHELVRLHKARSAGGLESETLVVRDRNLLRLFEILDLASMSRVVESLDEAVGKNGEDITVQYVSAFKRAAHVHAPSKV